MSGLKSLFGSPALPTAPNPVAPPVMPDPNSPAALEAARRTAIAAAQGGRASTQLTTAAPMSVIGGGYAGSKLGN